MNRFNIKNKFVKSFLIIYTIILLISALFVLPVHDTYYYWTWSQNIQLSYLDGPPLIAYLLFITTHIFGNTFFAINIISVLCLLLSGFFIYQIIRIIRNEALATVGLLLWLTYPFASIRFIITSATLDGLEVTTSLFILYLISKLIISNNKNYIFLIGFAVGLSLLAKYNSILLITSIVLYLLINKQYRQYILCWQFIIAIIIALVIFSPVLIWNYQHDFISFTYQMHVHDWNGSGDVVNKKENYGFSGVWFYLGSCVLGTLHVLLLILAYVLYKNKTINLDGIIKLCLFSTIFIFLIWLFKSYSAHIGLNYMLILSALIIIIIASLLDATNITIKKTWVFILLCATISTVMQIDRSIVHERDKVDYQKHVVEDQQLTRPFAK